MTLIYRLFQLGALMFFGFMWGYYEGIGQGSLRADFHAPSPPDAPTIWLGSPAISIPTFGEGWSINCIAFDGEKRTIEPVANAADCLKEAHK